MVCRHSSHTGKARRIICSFKLVRALGRYNPRSFRTITGYSEEKEIHIREDKNAVLLDADNFDYSCDNLLDSRFAFGLVFSKDTDLSEAIRRVALDDLIEKHARPHKLLDLNPLLLIDQAVTPNSALLQRSSDGRDRVCLHFFYEDGPVAIGLGRLTRELSEIVKVR